MVSFKNLIPDAILQTKKLSRHLRKKAFCVSDEDGESCSYDYYDSNVLISSVFIKAEK